jgi:membrane-bound lytic murein transglycosylase F
MKQWIILLIALTTMLIPHSCDIDRSSDTDALATIQDNSLSDILQRGKLIATTNYNSSNYFIYRGEPAGYEYEMLEAYAKHLGVDLELVVNEDYEEALADLERGEVDLIAMGIKVIGNRTRQVDFSKPLLQTRQVLVQRLPDNWRRMRTTAEVQQHLIRNPLDLAGKMVYVPRHSAYSQRLRNLQEEMGNNIVVVEFPQSDEKLIEMVARGEIDYTVCDEHVAIVNKKYFPDIDVETALSFPQNVAWAMKKQDNALQQNLDTWLETFTSSRVAQHIYNKYFVNPRSMQYAHKYHSVRSGRISRWDDILKQKSNEIGWDWRLIASLVYQESGFRSDAVSWMGAQGLMQLMPGTARIYGIDSLSSPDENIDAGIQYLKMLDDRFKDIVTDPDERIKFVLAAYNAGIAHVFDARRLAEKYGRDPNVWNDNVDYFLLNKSNPKYYNDEVVFYGYCRGEESFNYVNDILQRFEHYRNVIPG